MILMVAAMALILFSVWETKEEHSNAYADELVPSNEERAKKSLEILDDENASAEVKAKGANQLITCSYVLIGPIASMGSVFDEKKHAESFCNSMKPGYFQKLRSLVED